MIRPVKRALSWLELHPRTSTLLGLVAAVGAVLALVLTFYFHGQENSKIKAEKVARQAAAVAQAQSSRITDEVIRKTLCPLVKAYVHPEKGQHVPPQILDGWNAIGSLIGCK